VAQNLISGSSFLVANALTSQDNTSQMLLNATKSAISSKNTFGSRKSKKHFMKTRLEHSIFNIDSSSDENEDKKFGEHSLLSSDDESDSDKDYDFDHDPLVLLSRSSAAHQIMKSFLPPANAALLNSHDESKDDGGESKDNDWNVHDEEEDDDSDLPNDESVENRLTNKEYYIEMLGYDKRTYRFQFQNKADYKKWIAIVLSLNDYDPTSTQYLRQYRHSLRQRQRRSQLAEMQFTVTHSSNSGTVSSTNHSSSANTNNHISLKENQISCAELTSLSKLDGNKNKDMVQMGSNSNIAASAVINGGGGVGTTTTPSTPTMRNLSSHKNGSLSVDTEATKKYNKSLRNGERVIASGIVLKHEKTRDNASATNAPKQRRILLVTDLPRMIVIDTIGSVVRGNVELQAEYKMEIRLVRSIYSSCIR
jgi:hypothetical protein